MPRIALIIFFTSFSLLQVSPNNNVPHYHFVSEEAVFIYQHPEQEEELTRPSLDDFLDEIWDSAPPYTQNIILFIGGIGLVSGVLISLGYLSE
jgi:uncharacterized membrane protein YkgB